MFLEPQAEVTAPERERGLRNLLIDAAFATAIGALNSGVVLLALAIHIGATTPQIGVLAAIPLLTQMLQAPAVTLVERVRRRRLISIASVFTARLALPIYAAVPFIPDRDTAAAVLIFAALLHYGLNAVGSCSWNSWMRDLIPSDRLGAFFSRRSVYGTLVSAVATIAAAFALEWASGSESAGDRVFFWLYAVGFGCGIVSTVALARVPEPRMPLASGTAPLHRLLWQPLRDPEFRLVLRYLASWHFAVNLATPFLTVYFVRELGYSLGFVLLLTVVSQLANVAVVRDWGALSDRFANKSVLSAASPLFLLCIVAVAFAGELESPDVRAGYLILLHVIMGAAQAGVGLATGNMVIKLSPSGSATGYMATNALVGAVASGTAPIIGGWLTEFFARRQLALTLDWTSPRGTAELFGIAFAHWEFFFLFSAGLGLYALHRLTAVNEPGSVERREVVDHIMAAARHSLRNVSSVAGVRQALAFPAGAIIKSREGTRFLLESLFEQHRHTREPEVATAAIGTFLDASYLEPKSDNDLNALLVRLDEPESRRTP